MSVVKLCLYVSECVCSKIIKELPGLVGSGTPCITCTAWQNTVMLNGAYSYQRHLNCLGHFVICGE